MTHKFNELFVIEKPIIGMIHLAGNNSGEKLNRALEEIAIFEEEGIKGAIVEDYHGTQRDIENLFNKMKEQKHGFRNYQICKRKSRRDSCNAGFRNKTESKKPEDDYKRKEKAGFFLKIFSEKVFKSIFA